MQEESSGAPSAQFVGNAFVEQYYHILYRSPGLVHRFYQDSSFLSRPDSNGTMATVTTMQVCHLKKPHLVHSCFIHCSIAFMYVCWWCTYSCH